MPIDPKEATKPLPGREDYFDAGPGDVEWEKTPSQKVPDAPDLPDAAPRPSGQEHFDQMTKAEQDEALGPEIAEAVRKGEVKLSDLVARNDGDLITQASPKDLGIDTST